MVRFRNPGAKFSLQAVFALPVLFLFSICEAAAALGYFRKSISAGFVYFGVGEF